MSTPPLSWTPVGTPNTSQTWEDLETVLRHASEARIAGDNPRAHAFYARAVQLSPRDPRGWSGLGATASTLDEAIISWGYALTLAPGNFDAQIELDAHITERIERSGRSDAAVLVAVGRTLTEIGQKPSAYRLFTHATQLDPTNEEAWVWRAGLAQDLTETISCLNQALALNPSDRRAQAGLKWALAQQKPSAPTSPEAARQAQALCEQAQQALRADKTQTARDLFKRATELDPQNVSAWLWRGSTALNTDEALTCMERALEINPNDEAIKDARWWLRVKKIRESVRLPPSSAPVSSAAHVAATRRARGATAARLALTLALLAICAILLGIALIALRLV